MEKSLVANGSDEEQVKKAEKKEASGRSQDLEDIRAVLSTESGKRFVWKYLELCGLHRTSYTENPHTTMFLEGRRDIGLRLLADITEADPLKYVEMMSKKAKEGK